jgi:hypothetical protein
MFSHEPLLWDVEDVSMSPESVCAIRRMGSRIFAGSGTAAGRGAFDAGTGVVDPTGSFV